MRRNESTRVAIYGTMKRAVCLTLICCVWSCSEAPKPGLRFLALGDSYTIGERVGEQDRWPHLLIERLRAKGEKWEEPEYVAVTGWTSADLIKGVTDAGTTPPYGRVSLLIGANDVYQKRSLEDYRRFFSSLLSIAVDQAGGRKQNVFVVSMPDYSVSPYAVARDIKNTAHRIVEFNKAASEVCLREGVAFIDIVAVSKGNGPLWYASDGLHPSRRQYEAWVGEIEAKISVEKRVTSDE